MLEISVAEAKRIKAFSSSFLYNNVQFDSTAFYLLTTYHFLSYLRTVNSLEPIYCHNISTIVIFKIFTKHTTIWQ